MADLHGQMCMFWNLIFYFNLLDLVMGKKNLTKGSLNNFQDSFNKILSQLLNNNIFQDLFNEILSHLLINSIQILFTSTEQQQQV